MATSSEPLTDHRSLDWLAVSATSRIVAGVRDEHLNLLTPCAGWRVRDLLRHMVGNNRGFVAAALRARHRTGSCGTVSSSTPRSTCPTSGSDPRTRSWRRSPG